MQNIKVNFDDVIDKMFPIECDFSVEVTDDSFDHEFGVEHLESLDVTDVAITIKRGKEEIDVTKMTIKDFIIEHFDIYDII